MRPSRCCAFIATLHLTLLACGRNRVMKKKMEREKARKKLIKELMAHRSGWPFNKPVDITIFPQYTSVIANPMDLRTIDRKIDCNQYGTLDGFAADLKLVWSNCYQFNQDPTADVNIMAKELESIADERLLRIPEELEEKRAAKADDAQARALEAVKAHTAVPQKYSHHEDVPVDRSRQGHVMGVCVAFNRGYCRRGDNCRYEHAFTREAQEVAAATTFVDVREIPAAQVGRQPRKQPCFDLKHKGFCGRGAACPFAHTGHEGLPATRRQRKAQRAAEAQEPVASDEPPPPVRAVTR